MKKRYKKRQKNTIFRFTFLLMFTMIAGLLVKINDKSPFMSATVLENLTLQDIHKFFFWENLFVDEEAVSANMNYQLLKDHTYTNGSTEVTSLYDGVIVKTEDAKAIVLCDNGITISYEDMIHVAVKKEERILRGKTIGTMKESVKLRLYLEDEEITLEEAQKYSAD